LAKKALPSLQATNAFVITKSDSGSILTDAANTTSLYQFCYVHVTTAAGIVRVTPVDQALDTYVDIYVPLGGVSPLMVRKIWSTATTATGLVAFVGTGAKF
jgi:hypothetical protein